MHCIPDPTFNVSRSWVERNVINESPTYQRESGVWSEEKQQLFIDSLLNNYDIPKIYLHDLRGDHPKYHYAIVDGKQRLHTIWSFLDGKVPLASDFKLLEPSEGHPAPTGGQTFDQLDAYWQEVFKGKSLSIVLIQKATEDEIEDLFSRLNNGEPLNSAEKRNALGGDMAKLIREIATKPFFNDRVKFRNDRYQYLEAAAKIALLEKTALEAGAFYADLKKKFLDDLVRKGRNMPTEDQGKLLKRIDGQLALLERVFTKDDPLLAKQAAVPLYYLWVKRVVRDYGHPALFIKMHDFLESFTARRTAELNLPEEERDIYLSEFGRMMQQGTNDLSSLERRVEIATRYFLLDNPDVELKDRNRDFSDDERFAMWIAGGKACQKCGKDLPFEEMHADHEKQWVYGGPTSLTNARPLCAPCNIGAAEKVS